MVKGINKDQLLLFVVLSVITLGSLLGAFVLDKMVLFAVPVICLFVLQAVINFRKIFYLLMFVLPLSTEFEVGGGFATDLPTEPLIVALMLIFFVYAINASNAVTWRFFKHPLILLVLLHFGWMIFSTFYSVDMFRSVKFILAKLWYITVFVFFTATFIRQVKDYKPVFWLIFWPMTFTIGIVLFRHGFEFNFAFDKVNYTVYPFYRNHVNYAAMITAFFPFMLFARNWYQKGSWQRRVLNLAVPLYLIAIYFSYTRACYLALIVAAVLFIIMRLNLTKWALLASGLIIAAGIYFLVQDRNYMKLAPEYQKTVYHGNFGKHIQATYQMKDVSSMERVYRWVAGFHMTVDRPWTGVGPGNFYPNYFRYTVLDFRTYVSENPEKSTVHNYFLLMLTEQGYPGLVLFVLITAAFFLYAQFYYRHSKNPQRKRFIMAVAASMAIIYTNLMLSDLVEVDKTGSLFFMNIAMLVTIALAEKKEQEAVAIEEKAG